jgi:hypothetical protein
MALFRLCQMFVLGEERKFVAVGQAMLPGSSPSASRTNRCVWRWRGPSKSQSKSLMTASGCKRLVAHMPSTAVAPRRSVCLVRELRLRVRRFGLSFEARVGHEIMSPWLLPDGTHSGHATLVRLLISHTLSNCGPLLIQLSDPRRPIWQNKLQICTPSKRCWYGLAK